MYEFNEINLIKANKSIRQALWNYFEYRYQCNDELADWWITIYKQRIQFFCMKFNCSQETLAQYF